MEQQAMWEDYEHLKKEATKLRASEKRLKEFRSRYYGIFNSSRLLIAFLDKESVFLDINPFGAELLGKSQNEIIGKSFIKVFQDKAGRAIGEKVTKVLTDKKETRFEWKVSRVNKPHVQMSVSATPIADELGTFRTVVVIGEDISNLLTLTQQLKLVSSEALQLKDEVESLHNEIVSLSHKDEEK